MTSPTSAAAQLLKAMRQSPRAGELHADLQAHSSQPASDGDGEQTGATPAPAQPASATSFTGPAASSSSSSSSSADSSSAQMQAADKHAGAAAAATLSHDELQAQWDCLVDADDEPGIDRFLQTYPDFRPAPTTGASASSSSASSSSAAASPREETTKAPSSPVPAVDDQDFETDDNVINANANANTIRGNAPDAATPATLVELFGTEGDRNHWETWVTIGDQEVKFDLSQSGYRIIYGADPSRRNLPLRGSHDLTGITAGLVVVTYHSIRAKNGAYAPASNECRRFAEQFFEAVATLEPLPPAPPGT